MTVEKFDYSSIYSISSNHIERFGAEFTLQRLDSSFTKQYDSATGSTVWTDGTTTYTEPQYVESTAYGVVTDYTSEERYNTSIKVGDKKLHTVTIDDPQEQDIYIVGEVSYSYIDHETVQPSSTSDPLLYKIQLRV